MKTIGEWKKLFIKNMTTLVEETAPAIEDEATFMQGIEAMIADLKKINPEAAERYKKFALDAWKSGKLKSREDLEDQIEDDEVPSPEEAAEGGDLPQDGEEEKPDIKQQDINQRAKEFLQSYGVDNIQKDIEKLFANMVKKAASRTANRIIGADPDEDRFGQGAGSNDKAKWEREFQAPSDQIQKEIEKIINKALAVNENNQLIPYANLLIKEVNRIYGLRTNK